MDYRTLYRGPTRPRAACGFAKPTHYHRPPVSARPLIIAHHLIFTAYGWWLPNDPRGSSSRTIKTDLLNHLGQLHHGRKRVQPASHEIRRFYNAYACYACAIMPDHVHVLVRKHKHLAEQMITTLQEASRLRLREADLRPTDHPIWGGPGWKVFLDHPDEVRRTIRYIDENPLKHRLPGQRWSFVTPYDGWPLHPGHNPNSPYARRLRVAGRYPRWGRVAGRTVSRSRKRLGRYPTSDKPATRVRPPSMVTRRWAMRRMASG